MDDRSFRLSDRIRRRVALDFVPSDCAQVERTLVSLGADGDPAGGERIQAAVLIIATGRPDRLERAARDVTIDWRDVLMAADLRFDDWPDRVDAFLRDT